MKRLPRKYRDPLIFLSLLIMVPSVIYFISMNFGDQRVHIEKKQWNPSSAVEQGIDRNLLKRAAEYIETRLPMARGMIIIRNGKTVHEKYYWKGGPDEKDYLHSLNGPIMHALVGIAIEKKMLSGPEQSLVDFFPVHAVESGGLTIGDLLAVRAPLIWGDGPPEYWQLFFSNNRIGAAIKILSVPEGRQNQAYNFAANFLLAEVIRTASSMSVFEFADTYLFNPMGITTLSEIMEKGGNMDPFIGFQLRTLDLAKFGYMIMNRGVWDGKPVVPGAWAAKIKGELPGAEVSWGGWQTEMIGSVKSIIARGEGGQYIVLVPELDLLVAVSSKSRFPLSESNGYSHLFGLISEASDANLTEKALAVDPEDRPYYEPNFVYATDVPDEIRQFFLDLAKDINTNDINRILYHYAKGYENKGDNILFLDKLFLEADDYRSMYGFWRKIFYGGTGDLEFVHIEKLRIDGNRAYLRGSLKYSYANMNEGSFGWFPLENLIKLRGRWLWFGSPDYGAILDRDEYFDAEISADHEGFIDICGLELTGISGKNDTDCFAEGFLYNGLQQPNLQELLRSLWKGDLKAKMHITRVEELGEEALLEGYIENSLIGTISLPPGMKISRLEGTWKWSGNGRE
jgi:CubicO group peptidase (beta-lactamase class C family)